MKSAHRSDIGRRTVNEDRALVQTNVNGFSLAVIADGMGGHQAGDIASQMAIEIIQQHLQSIHTELTQEACMGAIEEAIVVANEKIYQYASQREDYLGMGTTVVVALIAKDYFIIGHIGDSRAYLYNAEIITQLTEDHSLVNELVKSGQISEEEASHHPRRNVITRALGTEETVEVDLLQFEWSPGSILLLCSDGLSGMVHYDELYMILNKDIPLESKVDLLIDHALEAGGDDNITAVLVSNEPIDEKEMG